ncbi:hypothetical protein HJC23_013535 [Cyclotella cryptica]|uniref:Centromere protein X n=1 Tax=Cyclotella cryptica TaxID=29204 RepID=A0ABD3NIW9_9STRA|eukprot:CCRYP_020911-RA/>CCRYP_020911-RA protein AED:0.00 eAED:0.00 QI:133/1/1/1/1/1/2/1510/123
MQTRPTTMTRHHAPHRDTTTNATIPPSLIRQCLTLHHPNAKYTNDAVELAAEFVRLLIIEARRRAAIEAECEAVANNVLSTQNEAIHDGDSVGESNKSQNKRNIEIRGDHIAKIAAEFLMDYS